MAHEASESPLTASSRDRQQGWRRPHRGRSGLRQAVRQIKIGKNPEFVRVLGDRAFVSYEPGARGGPRPSPAAPPRKTTMTTFPPASPSWTSSGQSPAEIVSGPETEGIEFSADGRRMAVTNEADNTITVYDLKNGHLLKTVPTKEYGNRPRGIKRSPDGKPPRRDPGIRRQAAHARRQFQAHQGHHHRQDALHGVAFDRSGQRLFVATSRDNAPPGSATPAASRRLPTFLWVCAAGTSVSRPTREILIACGKSNEILVIDADKLEVTRSIPSPGLPWGVVTILLWAASISPDPQPGGPLVPPP